MSISLIDFHTHIFPDDVAPRVMPMMSRRSGIAPMGNGTAGGLAAALPAGGLAVLQPVATRPGQAAGINHKTLDAAARFPQLLPFGAVHPGDEDIAGILTALRQQGVQGVKLHPDYQEISIGDPRYGRIFEVLQDLDMIALLHAGLDRGYAPPYRNVPEQLADVLTHYPRLRVVAAHMGGYCMWHAVERTLCGAPNLWFDTAFCAGNLPPGQAAALIKRHGATRVLFASDWPWGSLDEHIAYIHAMNLPEADIQAMLWRNAAALLCL